MILDIDIGWRPEALVALVIAAQVVPKLVVVTADEPTAAATCAFAAPGSAHASTIRRRNAYACVDVAARAPRTSSRRCASVTVNSGPDLGLPVLATTEPYNYTTDFRCGTLARLRT